MRVPGACVRALGRYTDLQQQAREGDGVALDPALRVQLQVVTAPDRRSESSERRQQRSREQRGGARGERGEGMNVVYECMCECTCMYVCRYILSGAHKFTLCCPACMVGVGKC